MKRSSFFSSVHFFLGTVLILFGIVSLFIGKFQAAGFLVAMTIGSYLMASDEDSIFAQFFLAIGCTWQAFYYSGHALTILFGVLGACAFGIFLVRSYLEYYNLLEALWQKVVS